MTDNNYAALVLRSLGNQARDKVHPVLAYCGTCGHKTYYVPDACPSCGSRYIKRRKQK